MIKHVKTLAACLSALLLAGCAASPTPAPTTTCYHVAMIAKSTSTEFWSAVFAGAEAAATEYNMDLTITGSESEEDYSSQNDLIEKAVEDGAQAIIFSASDYQKNAAHRCRRRQRRAHRRGGFGGQLQQGLCLCRCR